MLVPLFVTGWQRKWSIVAIAIGFAGFIYVTKREIQPWYLIWFIPWYALTPRIKWLASLGTGASLGYLFPTLRSLLSGDYNPPVPVLKLWLIFTPIAVSLIWIGVQSFICPARRPQV